MKKKILSSEENLIDIERLIRDGKKINNDDINEEYLKYMFVKNGFTTRLDYDKLSNEDIEIILKFMSLEKQKFKSN